MRPYGQAGKVPECAYVIGIHHVDESVNCGPLIVFGFELAADEAYFWYSGTVFERYLADLLLVIFSDDVVDVVAELTGE